ncbi:DinB family protein [Halobacillus shinanisalinarum]|uniref:DinB family protein n=1 Tax=Halobacillus shinanisalinarum TaxID=2932258 RepID=A0ABY4H5E9_9BACI|nr:DinB family protein [Halobacillus shinanisalinarum]
MLEVVENTTVEEAEIIPAGFNNNIQWNLGHVYLDQYMWIQAITRESTNVPEEFNSWFGFGTNPADFDDNTPSFEKLKKLLSEQPREIQNTYSDKLELEFPPTEMGMHTIEQVLVRTIFHEGMHIQTLLDLKKCM